MNKWQRFKKSYFLYSFRRDPVAVSSFAIFIFLVTIAFLAPVIAPYNPYDTTQFYIMDSEMAPSWMDRLCGSRPSSAPTR